jgi:hypothetical protein
VLESHREDRGLSGARKRSSRADAGGRKRAASKRWSTRIFGEYAFLEDSRYASQAKNTRGKNSHTIARVSGGELVKSATERRSPDAAATRALRGLRYWDEHERRLCPMREPGDIGAVVDA